ncbi:hypothetical protein QJQ45_023312 [Haematococcus lacustris]|nr:hypothetical protein QJQ45_023312 [Haematococcus lacustris]
MATSPASASGNQPTILDDDNWPIWNIRTEGLLIEAGLWPVVADGVTPLPTAPAANATQQEQTAYAAELARSRADSALDRKAKAFIQRHVSNLHIFTVKSAGSAQDAWETLESQFTESSVARQSQLQQRLSLLRMEPGESVARFFARLQQLLTELEACNCETSESTVVLAILAALPPEYEGTVERLRYDQTSADLKVERIKRVLLTKEADLLSKQMQQQLSTSSSSLWSYSSPSDSRGAGSSGGQGGRGRLMLSQRSREQQSTAQQQQARAQSPDRSTRDVSSHAHLTCNYCAKPGHIMSECFTFDRDQRNRMKTLFSNPARPSSPGRRPSPGRSSSPARTSSPSRGRAQTPGRAAAQSPSRGASLFTCSTADDDDDDDDLDDVLMQMMQPRLNFNSDLYSPFCIDSGASQHILKDLQYFYNYTPFAPDKHRPVRLAAEGHRVWAIGSGSVFLNTKRGSWFLSHALYVPDSKQNFISVTAATDDGSSFLFRGDVCQISCNQFGSMLRVNAHKVKNSYILAAVPMPDGPDTESEPEQLYGIQQSAQQPDPRVKLELLTNVAAPSANSSTSDTPQVWHQRLCHTSYDALARMQSANMVSGVPVTAAQFRAAASDPAVCVGCVKGKQHKNVAFAGPPPNAAPVTAPLGLIHMDVCGPMHARARDGSLYVATFLDEHTKLSVCVPISSKAQVPDTVRTVIEQLVTQSGYRCKAIRTDNGTEYVNSRMREYCASKGIVHQHSAPYSPQPGWWLPQRRARCTLVVMNVVGASFITSGNQPTILNDDNWPIWNIRTEGLLIEAGLWPVVADGVTPLPTAPAANATQQEQTAYAAELARSRADSALDRKAKAFIQRHVSNLHIFTVKSAGSAQDAWETLESQFTESSVARQSQLQQRLSLLRMEPGESVARFFARLQQLLTELEACNCETSESTVVLAILAALPPEYEGTVERLRYDQTSADLKVERIKRVLLTKEADLLSKQMQQQLSTSSSSLWSYSSPSDSRGAGSSGGQGGRGRLMLSQRSREQQSTAQQQQARAQSPDRSTRDVSSHAHLTCNYCAKPGHIMSECFTFDRDQRNRMKTLFSNPARPSSPGRRPSPGRSSSPARTSSPSRGRAQTPGRAAAQSPSRGASLFTCSTADDDDDDDDLDDVLMQMMQPRLNFNSDLYSPFCIDSGASQHILKDLQYFYNYTPFAPDKHRPVRLAAEGHRVWAIGSGSVFLNTKRGSWFLSHALYVPDSKQNFISVTAATDDGSSFLFRGDVCQISCNQFGSMLRVNAHKVKNSYILAAVPMPDGPDTESEPEQLYGIQQSAQQPDPRVKLELLTNVAAPSANSSTSDTPQVWHQRLCHTSYDALARMQSANMVSGVPVTAAQFRAAASDPAVCVGCVKGKQHKNVAFAGPPPNAAPVTAPLGLIHMDVCGPMHARARDGSLYVATFLDEHTKLSVCVPISSKAQVPDTVRTVIEQLETQSGYRCKAIRTDNGTEYVNSRMREYCASKGIVHQHSAPYSPQQNGAAERLNRTIFEKARSIIHSADISLSFWAHAVKFANYVRCLLPVSGQPLTPWEAFYGVKPDLSGLRHSYKLSHM